MEEPCPPGTSASKAQLTPDEAEYVYRHDVRERVVERAEVSVLYHRARERFYDVLDRTTKVITLVAGSAAAFRILRDQGGLGAALVTTIASALSLAFTYAERSRRHATLAQQFARLLADIAERGPRDFDERDLCSWDAAIRKVEVDEPAPLPVVQAVAQYDYYRTVGKLTHRVPFWRRMVGQVIPIQPFAPGHEPPDASPNAQRGAE